jgi:hypothetical protein
MLQSALKCRYLSQFSMGELSKTMTANPTVMTKAADRCPFMVI